MDSLVGLWYELRKPVLTLAAVVVIIWALYRVLFRGVDSKLAPNAPLEKAQPVERIGPKRIVGRRKPAVQKQNSEIPHVKRLQPIIFFLSKTGNVYLAANLVTEVLNARAALQTSGPELLKPRVLDISHIDLDDYFTAPPQADATRFFYIFLIPTYEHDVGITEFVNHLKETHHDFRVDTAPLSSVVGYSVFGFGDREGWPTEAAGYCSQATEVDKWVARLTGGKRAYPLGMGDMSDGGDAWDQFDVWMRGTADTLVDIVHGKDIWEGVPGSGDAIESDEEDEAVDDENIRIRKKTLPSSKSGLADLESLGSDSRESPSSPVPVDFTTVAKTVEASSKKEMVPTSSSTYTALTKQGYTIIGSHSGVKICRWTKSALRGRGSCYKFSFYGIRSHLCMEMTPSLSCSNKCVFCWRHGTNPVSTTWRWKVDPPQTIFDGAKEGHYKKIKMMRGVPGVRAERFEEAMTIRHCALSLVGEPIFYPHINEFVTLLHNERISSFLVCNAQHPNELAALKKVTQLYVSIDASNREALRKIDRPLHRDFWERLLACLGILCARRFIQRTVFRLTLVKGFNTDDVEGYADLIARGMPGFVEVKGVTYCGTSSSTGADLTMKNVPFYVEVQDFVISLEQALQKRGLNYAIAAEHAHSCCVLIADRRFQKEDAWQTGIDYQRFFELLESGNEFGPEDYMAETPEWAVWGNEHGGFNPEDQRVDRKGKPLQ